MWIRDRGHYWGRLNWRVANAAYWVGVSPPSVFFCLTSLYSRRQANTIRAWGRLVNQYSFRHSSRSCPFSDSTYALWFGLQNDQPQRYVVAMRPGEPPRVSRRLLIESRAAKA
jgi:hypothetical protein